MFTVPLAKVVLGQQQVQGLDYIYTLQSWLKSVKPSQVLNNDGQSATSPAADAFSYVLHYNSTDYQPINSAVSSPDALVVAQLGSDYRSLYNGNISGMGVNVGKLKNPLWYNYKYDQLNRLVQMDAWSDSSSWSGLQKTTDYKEAVRYDANGNITSYDRNGIASNSNGLAMDRLTYHYTSGSNQLTHITDSITDATTYDTDIDNQDTAKYTYDAIGNMTKDNAANIQEIKWNVYGKIDSIIRIDGSIVKLPGM